MPRKGDRVEVWVGAFGSRSYVRPLRATDPFIAATVGSTDGDRVWVVPDTGVAACYVRRSEVRLCRDRPVG